MRAAFWLAIALGAVAVGILTARILRPESPRPQLVIVRPQTAGNRIVYPAKNHPVLTLPDGDRQPVRSLLNIARPMRFGDYVWDDAGVPQGSVWVRVDLSQQTISAFRAGHEIGSAVILYGADDKPTPVGVYPVLQRAEKHRSSLYDADMPYMLRLTGDGVAIHASSVRAYAATHGCIGVPIAFARRLFEQVRRGDRVAIVASGLGSPSGRPPPTT